MKEWPSGKITDLVQFRTGKLNSNAEVKNGKYPFFTCSPETLRIDDYAFDCEALLLAGNNAEGNFALKYYAGKFNAYQRTYVITIPETRFLSYKYLFYALQTRLVDLKNVSAGSATKFLTLSILNDIEVPLPAVEEQKSIASVLSSLDDKIDLLHRQNKTLESMAETLFRQWFVEGAGDWEKRPLSSIAVFLNGLACQKFLPENELDKLPVLKIKELSSGISDSCDWATSNVDKKYIVEAGDVIFSWSASLMVKVWDGPRCVLNQHLFKVTSDVFPKWFYLMWCRHHLAEFIAISQAHATTMGHIKRGDLDEALVLVPPWADLESMSVQMTPLLDKQISNAKQIKMLEKLRDGLLPKLMSGEVRVAPEEKKYG